jgi:uncharacterized protein (DUF433 family)
LARNTAIEGNELFGKSPTLTVRDDPIPIRIDEGGAVRVGSTRVTIETVLEYYKRGYSPERIQESFPSLKLADIYSVIGYYLRHTDEVDEYLRQSAIEAEVIRQKIEAHQNTADLRAKLEARRTSQRN